MRVILIITLLVISGCAKNSHTHTLNHCGGIDIPVCEYEVEGEMSLEEQEKVFKHKMLSSMNLILDQVLQNLLMSIK